MVARPWARREVPPVGQSADDHPRDDAEAVSDRHHLQPFSVRCTDAVITRAGCNMPRKDCVAPPIYFESGSTDHPNPLDAKLKPDGLGGETAAHEAAAQASTWADTVRHRLVSGRHLLLVSASLPPCALISTVYPAAFASLASRISHFSLHPLALTWRSQTRGSRPSAAGAPVTSALAPAPPP